MIFETLHWIKNGIWDSISDRVTMGGVGVSYLSSAMLLNMNFDLSLLVAGAGILTALSGVAKNSLESYRTYLSIKKDKVQADKMIKELDKEESEDSDKDNGSNI